MQYSLNTYFAKPKFRFFNGIIMVMWGCWFWPRFVVGSGIVWLLAVALWTCGSWFWLWPHLVVGCGHMLLLVVTTARCVVGLLDVASFGCWLWPRVLWATPAPNWQLSTGVLASWPWSPRCNLTKKSMKLFLGQCLVRISWQMYMGYVAEGD